MRIDRDRQAGSIAVSKQAVSKQVIETLAEPTPKKAVSNIFSSYCVAIRSRGDRGLLKRNCISSVRL